MGNEIVDSATNLTWSRQIFSAQNIMQATATCTSWAGGRIPTEAEIQAFVTAAGPCANTIKFPAPPSGECVWSSTPDPSNASFNECVYFDGTQPMPVPQTDGQLVLCVK